MTVAPLSDDELLLRRIDPDGHLVTHDEGTERVQRLNWAALRWDEDECSVYREKLLQGLGLSRRSILEAPYVGIATSTRRKIHAFEHPHPVTKIAVHPFTARESPRTDPPPLETDPAHASVLPTGEALSRKQLGKAQVRLAREAFEVVDPSGGPCS